MATTADHYFGFRTYGLDGQRVQIADAEKALIDLLQFHRTSATVALVLETLRDAHHQLELDRLTQYARRSLIAEQPVLGFLFDLLELDASALAAATHKRQSVTRLHPKSDQCHSGWRSYHESFFANSTI